MGNVGGPRKETDLPKHCPDNTETRHSHMVKQRQVPGNGELTVPWESRSEDAYERKKSEVFVPARRVQRNGMASMALTG